MAQFDTPTPFTRGRFTPVAKRVLAGASGVTAVSALGGAVALMTGAMPLPSSIAHRLPVHSPVFGGVALTIVVAVPMATSCWTLARDRRAADLVLALSGVLLAGWIVVEVATIRAFSWLQPAFGLLGLVLAVAGYRSWHLRWGASDAELGAQMPGDDEVSGAQFRATRAITIDAPPQRVWPWIVQVGRSRAGFYSYDRLDNDGRPSAREILPQFQQPHAGDLAAPMTPVATELTAFRVHLIEAPTVLLWSKPDSTWCWQLRELPGGRTRLVTRLRVRYEWAEPRWAVGSLALIEVADFPMMRKMLRGIRDRAESSRG